jgi:hypothetical protein
VRASKTKVNLRELCARASPRGRARGRMRAANATTSVFALGSRTDGDSSPSTP